MKFAASTTLKRAGAAVAVVATLLSATGCGYIYHQPTTIVYSASDGVMGNIADVKLRNIMIIAADEDSAGRILGTIVNDGKSDATVSFDFPSGAKTVQVAAGKTVRLEDSANELIVDPAGANPGEMISDVKVTSSAGGDTEKLNIPVLDGSLEEYKEYLPNAASATAEASSTANH